MKRFCRVYFAFVLLACTALTVRAEEPADADAGPQKVSYYKQIRPVFQAHCQGCHQPAKRSGDYVMTEFAALLAGGESETPAIVPGDVEDSYLIDLITPEDGTAEMPKGEDKTLAQSDIELIRRWIAEGAIDDTPDGAKVRHDPDHPPTYDLPPTITALDFSPDGQWLAVSGYHEVLLHKADGSALAARLIGISERIESVRFSPDGKLLAVTGGLPARMGEVQIWDVESRTLKLSVPVTYDTVYGASWSPDGKLVGFGCTDNTIRAIDAATGAEVLYNMAHNDWVLDTVFSVDGKHVVSVSRDRSMKLIVVSEQRFVDNITSITPGALKGGLLSVDRHPTKDELLVGGADGVPKTYLMHRTKQRTIGDDFQKIRAFEEMPGRVFAVAYSADGNRIVAGSSYNGQGEVRVYQTGDGKLLWKHAGQAYYTVAFRPDGKAVAAAGFHGKVQLLDADTGKVIQDFLPVPLTNKKKLAVQKP